MGKNKAMRSRRSRCRGGSMAGRLALPAGLLVLQKMMQSRRHKKHSSKKHRTVKRRGVRNTRRR